MKTHLKIINIITEAILQWAKYLSGIGDDGQPVIDPEEAKLTTKLKKLVQPNKNEEETE